MGISPIRRGPTDRAGVCVPHPRSGFHPGTGGSPFGSPHGSYISSLDTFRASDEQTIEAPRPFFRVVCLTADPPPRSILVTKKKNVETPASQEVALWTPVRCNDLVTITSRNHTQITRVITSDFFHRILRGSTKTRRNISKITTYVRNEDPRPQ